MKNYSNDVCQVWGGSYNFFHSSQTKTSFSFYWKSNFKQVSVTHFKTFNKLKRKTQFFHFCLLKNLGSNRTRHWWIGGNFSLGKLFILFHSDIKEILFRRKSNFQQVVKFVLIFLWTVLCYSSRNNVKLNRLYQVALVTEIYFHRESPWLMSVTKLLSSALMSRAVSDHFMPLDHLLPRPLAHLLPVLEPLTWRKIIKTDWSQIQSNFGLTCRKSKRTHICSPHHCFNSKFISAKKYY